MASKSNNKESRKSQEVRRESYKKLSFQDEGSNSHLGPMHRSGPQFKRSKPNAPTTKKYKDFRKYLTKGNVMRTLIKLLAELYEEETPPKNIREYIVNKLVNDEPLVEEAYQEMRTRLRGIHCQILEIEEEIEQLQEVVKLYAEVDQASNSEGTKQN